MKAKYLFLLSLYFALVSFGFNERMKDESQLENVKKNFIDNLTINESRQQLALDEIAHWDDAKLRGLYIHLTDERKLASSDVKILITSKDSTEKYHLTKANTVGQVLLRYLCYRTGKCDGGFDEGNPDELRRQFEKIARFCHSKYEAKYCPRRGRLE